MNVDVNPDLVPSIWLAVSNGLCSPAVVWFLVAFHPHLVAGAQGVVALDLEDRPIQCDPTWNEHGVVGVPRLVVTVTTC
eukprot:5078690-Amphidinium_carterae.1